MDLHYLPFFGGDAVADTGSGREEGEIELSLQSLLDDLHVQQA